MAVAMLPLLATAGTAASSVVTSGAAAIQSALSVHCATVHNDNLNDANRIKDEYGRGRSTEVVLVNLTAHPLELRTRVDFKGGVWKYPAPSVVAPEKGANFLHVGGLFGFGGSSGGLSYDVGGLGFRVDLMWRNACCGSNWVVAEFAGNDEARDWGQWRQQVVKDRRSLRDYANDRRSVDPVAVQCRATIGQASTSVCVLTLY